MKIATLVLIIYLPLQCALGQGYKLALPESTGHIEIRMADVFLKLHLEEPILVPALPAALNWEHSKREKFDQQLAGIQGVLTRDVFKINEFKLEREVWSSDDMCKVAMRNRITNLSGKTIQVDRLIPVSIKGSKNFQLGSSDPETWQVMVQKRLKNGRPGTFTPQVGDKQEADPLLIIHRPSENGPDLFVGFLSHELHLAQLELEFVGNSKAEFSSLSAICDFEQTDLPPGGQRSSQWVLLTVGNDARELLFEYGDLVGKYHSISPPPSSAPSVFCTWYYYAEHYNEAMFNKDVVTFGEQQLPFDVFLIDECWSMNLWGDYRCNDHFPSGMKYVADEIRSLGIIPGIWTPPFLVDEGTNLALEHPEWLLKDSKGKIINYTMNGRDHWILDVTYPGAADYLERSFRKLSRDWGYDYFKFDFMRAIFLDHDQQFYDKNATSLEAYRMGLEAIRRGVGESAYISVCGGHYGASIGIANSQRSGSDVLSVWGENEIPKYRQNILRTWMSRLWHVDPDAMMVRRQTEPLSVATNQKLSLGLFTDEEAQTNALNQFLGGGLVTTTEDFSVIDPDRKELYKHVIPSINKSSVPLDLFDLFCPGVLITEITPKCKVLEPWTMMSVVNWTEKEKDFEISLNQEVFSAKGQAFLVSEFFSQEVLGIYRYEEILKITALPPHHSRLFRIAPWNGRLPVLAGTDLHFSSGGVEIDKWKIDRGTVEGSLSTIWDYPVCIKIAIPDTSEKQFRVLETKILPGKTRFWIDL